VISPEVKGDCLEILGDSISWSLKACPGLYTFTFTRIWTEAGRYYYSSTECKVLVIKMKT